ncbi:MAG: SDR family NAD(P)-dependent oxidoreductase [Aggregatilineales bacterium]
MASQILARRTAVITGASQGLGRVIAQAYIVAGANVILCARDAAMLETVRSELTSLAGPDQRVIAHPCDVSNPTDVTHLIETAFRYFPQVDILVNNAGIYGPKGSIEDVDWDEWVQAISINLFGSVLLIRALLPHFKANHYGKIIQLSGGGATNPLPYISAYAASKAAVVRFAETLAEEVLSDHIDVNAVAPGMLNTRLLDEALGAGPEKVGAAFYARALKQKNEGGVPLERGAALTVFLASAASDGITGKLISAVWDPWDKLQDYRSDLQNTDVYTLRRIVPSDRGLEWGKP